MVLLQMVMGTVGRGGARTLEPMRVGRPVGPVAVLGHAPVVGHRVCTITRTVTSTSTSTSTTGSSNTTRHSATGAALVAITELEIRQHGVVAVVHGIVGAESGLALADDDIEGDSGDEGDGSDDGEGEEGLVDATDGDAG